VSHSICFPVLLPLTLLRRKDAIDIDNFAEYEAMVKKIIDEAPSKLSVFFSLDDVKAAARVSFFFVVCVEDVDPIDFQDGSDSDEGNEEAGSGADDGNKNLEVTPILFLFQYS